MNAANPEPIRSILFAALAKVAGRESRRDQLAGGKEHQVAVEIAGRVDRRRIKAVRLEATLHVGHDTTRVTSQAVPTEDLVAFLLDCLPAKARADLLVNLPALFERRHTVPTSEARLEEARGLLKRLNLRVGKAVRGEVSATVVSLEG